MDESKELTATPAAIAPAMRDDPREAFLAGRLTEKTRTAYRQDLNAFFEFAGIRAPADITADRVTAWRNSMMDAGLRSATIARKLTALRGFADHLVYHRHLERNPADPKVVRTPRVSGASRTNGLSYGQAARLLESIDRTTLRGTRDYAMVRWLLQLGLRRVELCGITVADLGEERGHHTVRVAGKGGKDRLLPIKPSLWQATLAYLEVSGRSLDGEPATAPLFTSTRPRSGRSPTPLTDRTVWNVVTRYVRAAGIKKRISPHSLRHTAITLALDAGATIRQAQTYAGHADPKTTVRYDRTREDLDKSAAHLIDFGDGED